MLTAAESKLLTQIAEDIHALRLFVLAPWTRPDISPDIKPDIKPSHWSGGLPCQSGGQSQTFEWSGEPNDTQ